LPNAVLSLFVVSSRDGWVDIMQHAMDARGRNQTPYYQYNTWAALYFVAFILTVGYFVLNMFVGVIVENFQLTMPVIPRPELDLGVPASASTTSATSSKVSTSSSSSAVSSISSLATPTSETTACPVFSCFKFVAFCKLFFLRKLTLPPD
jgi:hypothetical protein